MRTVCCVCYKVKCEDGWVKQRKTRSDKYSHGYCPDCYRETMQRIERNCRSLGFAANAQLAINLK